MMWRRKRRGPSPEAVAARIHAERKYAETVAATPKYERLAASLRELREHNNFAAAIETSFRGGQQ